MTASTQSKNENALMKTKSAQQIQIPLGLNRWLYVSIICVFVIFHGPIVMNWTAIRSMLVKSHVYSWRCGPGDAFDADGTCGVQREGITMLGNIGQTSMFVGSAVAGVIADAFGPRMCSFTGGCLFMLSFLLLAVSSQKLQLYIPHVLVQGLAVESSFFGVLTIPNLFPKHRGLLLSVLGAARSLSMFYSVAMNKMTSPSFPLRHTALTCLGISCLFTGACYMLLPTEPYRLLPTLNAPPDLEQAEEEEEEDQNANEPSSGLADLLHYARKPFYLCFLAFFAFSFTRATFYGLSVADQHRAVSDVFAITNPLSFIPCPFMGFLADWQGMLTVMAVLNTCGTLMFICLIIGSALAAQWVAVILSCVVFSFLASQCYCLIQEQYNENVRGRLAGAAMCTAGLFSLVSTPIYNWATRTGTFKGADGVFLGLSALCYLLLLAMWYTQETKAIEPGLLKPKVTLEEPQAA